MALVHKPYLWSLVQPVVPVHQVGSVVPRSMKINKLSQNFDSVHQYDLPGKFGQAWTTPEQPHGHLQHTTKIRRVVPGVAQQA